MLAALIKKCLRTIRLYSRDTKPGKDWYLRSVQDQSENDGGSKLTRQDGSGQRCHRNSANSQGRDNENVGNGGSNEPYRWAESPEVATPSQGVNGGLAAVYDGNDRKRSQGFDSELHFELADRDDSYTER